MKIAFVHTEKEFTSKLFNHLQSRLTGHEIISWEAEKAAPATDFEIAVVMGKFTREQMAGQAKLALIQTVSAGYDGIDIDAASEMGILVAYSPSGLTGNAISVAEFAMMLILGASRRLNQMLQPFKGNAHEAPGITTALYGKTVCIVGLGAIGKLLADRLKPFEVHITAVDDHPHQVPQGVTVFPSGQLLQAIAGADYVVICARATNDNENLVNAGTLKAMKEGAILVNISRGAMVDETALFDAVKSGHLAAAGLDVTKKEPVGPHDPLLTLPQVLITPHIAGATDITLKGMADYAVQVVADFSAGKKIRSVVNKPDKPRYANYSN